MIDGLFDLQTYITFRYKCDLRLMNRLECLFLSQLIVPHNIASVKYLLDNQQTARLLFRKIELADFNQWLSFFEDPQTNQHWVSEDKPAFTTCEDWYHRQQQRYDEDLGGMNALIEKSTGMLVGHAGLLIQQVDGQTEMEVAYSLLPAYWGKGYAVEAATKCRDFAFQNAFANTLISIISVTNTPSVNVALRNGMQVSHETIYKGNRVKIFRITREAWLQLSH